MIATELPPATSYSYVQTVDNVISGGTLDSRRNKMLEHLEAQNRALESQGLVTSYYKSEDEATLSWYDKSDSRNSISLWLDDCEGVWSSAKNGQVIDRVDFQNARDFLRFSL